MEKEFKNDKRIIEIILTVTDYLFIGIKCLVFCYAFRISYLNENPFVGEIYSHFISPFVAYFVINLSRLIKSRKWVLLLIEIVLNFYFIFCKGNVHFIYLGMSIISFVAISYQSKLKSSA